MMMKQLNDQINKNMITKTIFNINYNIFQKMNSLRTIVAEIVVLTMLISQIKEQKIPKVRGKNRKKFAKRMKNIFEGYLIGKREPKMLILVNFQKIYVNNNSKRRMMNKLKA